MRQPADPEPSETEYIVVEDATRHPPLVLVEQPYDVVEEVPREDTVRSTATEPEVPEIEGEALLVLPSLPQPSTLAQMTEHLGKLSLVTARAEEERRRTLRKMDEQVMEEVHQLREENQELRTRNAFLERELACLRDGKRLKLQVVGDLERTTTTVSLALRPHDHYTQVYWLYSEDVRLLDLDSRDTLMSCERIWSGSGGAGKELIDLTQCPVLLKLLIF